ncbi:glycosyltransferase family 4 protein [Acidianus sp. RZ1]|uniref:glycosyltransferase family 4 protein n=1 Tax=Acidianus sp. RZ1 TaxID=1540082 RepID=UPI001491A7C3|nr:glycosyltransferase family 4 protein [Acidianus sp. RZ1]NON63529.1 glycosyltransferase family 4 protein [Acidianus sp. RZ1]
MKVLILVRVLWPGGVQRAAFKEAYELMKRGHDVDLVFIRETQREVKYSSSINYTVLYPPTVKKRLLGKVFWKLTSIYAKGRGDDATIDLDLIFLYEMRRKKNYDVVIYYDQWTALFSWVRKLKEKVWEIRGKKGGGEKKVVFVHETPLSNPNPPLLPKLIDRLGLWKANCIITNAEANREALERNGYKNVFTLYLGTDPVDSPNFSFREDIALSVTMWDAGRHPERLVEISRRLRRGKVVIAGDWADRTLLEKYRNMRNEHLEVTGPLQEDELRELYRRSKAFIRFGYNERGPGMGSLEALSYGIPLIVNRGIGITEVIKDKENGFIVEENDFDGISKILDELFVNEEMWNKIYENNRKLAESLSWNKHGERLDEIIRKIANE